MTKKINLDDRNSSKDREVDKISVEKSKSYLWKYLQNKFSESPEKSKALFWRIFTPLRLSLASATALVLVVALLVTQNMGFIGVSNQNVAFASFELNASSEDVAGIDENSYFILKSSEDFDENDIKDRIIVKPEFSFDVEKTKDMEFKIIPNSDLKPNTIYSFRINGTNDVFSWAYQVKDSFKISSTIPAHKSNYVPINTGIEFNFNSSNFDLKDFETHFEINPKVSGKFDKKENTAIFIPSKLDMGVLYTVTVTKGLQMKGSDLILKEDNVVQFVTDTGKSGADTLAEFTDQLNEVPVDEDLALKVYYYGDYVTPYSVSEISEPEITSVEAEVLYEMIDDNTDPVFEEIVVSDAFAGDVVELKAVPPVVEAVKVENTKLAEPFEVMPVEEVVPVDNFINDNVIKIKVFEYDNEDQFIDALKEVVDVPYWAYGLKSSNRFHQDTSKLKSIGIFDSMVFESNVGRYISVPDFKLDRGLYLVEIQDENKSQTLLQVSNLSAYISVSLTDTIAWLNDVSTSRPVENANIQLLNDNKDYKTNSEGIAVFDSSFLVDDSSDDELKKDAIIRMNNGDDVLYKLLSSYYSGTIRDYWLYMITDRPMYLPNDTVKTWGFIKDKNTNESPAELKISLTRDYDEEIFESDVNVDNGFFEGEIKLNNLLPGYYTLNLKDGDTVLSNEFFQISNYVKPAYNISLEANKKHFFVGEKVNIDVKTEFFEGTPLPFMDLNYNDINGEQKKLKTDENGDANINFVVPEFTNNYGGNNYSGLTVNSAMGESTDISENVNFIFYESKYDISSEYKVNEGIATINAKLNYVDLEKANNNLESYFNDYISDPVKNEKISAKVTVSRWNKEKVGDSYDYINKINIPEYRYTKEFIRDEFFTMQTDLDGKASYELRVDDDMYYEVSLSSDDGEIGTAHDLIYLDSRSGGYGYYEYYSVNIVNGEEKDWRKSFNIGDTVKSEIVNNNNNSFDGNSDWKYLFMEYNNGLKSFKIEDNPSHSSKFTDDFVPSMNISAVWFDGKTYKIAWGNNAYLKLDEKKLDIEIKPDKEKYEPGEYVKLKIKVSDLDGNGVKSTVHLNLIDEAYYKLIYDNLENPLDTFYGANWDGVIDTEISHKNVMEMSDTTAGMGGCFVGDTLIKMEDGTEKYISDIEAGDRILTRKSEFSGDLIGANVSKTYEHLVANYLEVNGNLKVTQEHVLFINGKWDIAWNLHVGDFLLNESGELVKVKTLERINNAVKVYNFEVEDFHTYFANGFYVHNDKGGDGVRDDFEDNALFKMVTTDNSGNASLEFQLPDNISSWRTTVLAIDPEDMKAGMNSANINVSLPLFGDIVMNQEYSVKDEPEIKVRAYGDSLTKGDALTFDIDGEKQNSEAFNGVYFKLGDMSEGEHKVTVNVASDEYKDALAKTYDVVKNRFEENVLETDIDLQVGETIARNADGITEITFMDSAKSFYYQEVMELYYWSRGIRLDQLITQKVASRLMKKYYNEEFYISDSVKELDYQTETGGLSLLPYSSDDLNLTTMYLLMADSLEGFDSTKLSYYLDQKLGAEDINYSEYVQILSAKVALGESVLSDLKNVKQDDLLNIDKLYLGIALSKIGEKGDAKLIYNKLKVKESDMQVRERALYAVLAASLGLDEDAYALWTDTEMQGLEFDLINLYRLGFVNFLLENNSFRPGGEAVKFSIVKGGEKIDVNLEDNNFYSVYLDKDEDISVTKVSNGKLASVSYYSKLANYKNLETDSRIDIKREYLVDGEKRNEFKEGELVEVKITVKENQYMANNSYYVTDILPAGLTTLNNIQSYKIYSNYSSPIIYPSFKEKQTVKFYVWVSNQKYDEGLLSRSATNLKDGGAEKTFSYYAKVISPGKYYAEPSKVEAIQDTNLVNIGEEDYVLIN